MTRRELFKAITAGLVSAPIAKAVAKPKPGVIEAPRVRTEEIRNQCGEVVCVITYSIGDKVIYDGLEYVCTGNPHE